MWYKYSQQWHNKNNSQAVPYTDPNLSYNPNRTVWQDQNYIYFVDDSNQKRSIQKSTMNDSQSQQFFGRTVNQIPNKTPNQPSGQSGHHNYPVQYNRNISQAPMLEQTPQQQQFEKMWNGFRANPWGAVGDYLNQNPIPKPNPIQPLTPSDLNPFSNPPVKRTEQTPDGRDTVSIR